MQLLDERGIRRVGSVIGIGFGGLAALHFGALYPGRVASIVADSPPGGSRSVRSRARRIGSRSSGMIRS